MKQGVALFLTAFPIGNYRGAGAGEQISLLRVQALTDSFERVIVLVCSHVRPPIGVNGVPRNAEVRYCQVRAREVLGKGVRDRKYPTIFHHRDTSSVRAAVADLLNRVPFSDVFFDFSQTFSLVDTIGPHVRRIAFVHDVQAQRTARQWGLARLLLPLVRAEERRLLSQFDSVVALSEKDRALLRSIHGLQSSIDDWETRFDRAARFRLCGIRRPVAHADEGMRLMFFGNLRRSDNWTGLVLFLASLALWKLFHRGSKPHRVVAVGECGPWLRRFLNVFGKSVRVTGFVPEPYQWLAGADRFIAPLFRGAGIKIKVKEYQQFATPVYGTATAFEGITRRPIDIQCGIFDMVRRIADDLTTGSSVSPHAGSARGEGAHEVS